MVAMLVLTKQQPSDFCTPLPHACTTQFEFCTMPQHDATRAPASCVYTTHLLDNNVDSIRCRWYNSRSRSVAAFRVYTHQLALISLPLQAYSARNSAIASIPLAACILSGSLQSRDGGIQLQSLWSPLRPTRPASGATGARLAWAPRGRRR